MAGIFSDRKNKLDILKALRNNDKTNTPAERPAYMACPECQAEYGHETVMRNYFVCPRCGNHLRMPSRARVKMLFDSGTAKEYFTSIKARNPISFPDYEEKLAAMQKATGSTEACTCAVGNIGGHRVICAVLEPEFLMGSMGIVVGEKIAMAAEYATANKLSLIIFSASGGARMQEGIYSLMQMAKTSAAIKKHSDAGGLYISCITNPTTGGVTASFASLGDITLAEPGALFGFSGPRVIEQTIGEKLPEGFQRSEFQLEHGFVDAIVERREQRKTIIRLLNLHKKV